jgi:cell division septation protein DedD
MIRSLLITTALIILPGSFISCSSSEETETPEQTGQPALTETSQPTPQGEAVTATVVAPPPSSQQTSTTTTPSLTTKQDTVIGATEKKSPQTSIERKKNAASTTFYTVQIGAFRDPSNALRIQKTAKQRYSDQETYNKFDSRTRLYRVTIGNFPINKDAGAFAKTIARQYPQDFGAGIVVQMINGNLK